MQMEIKTCAAAGTLESSDAYVSVEPNLERGLKIEIESSVEKQYGNQIKKVAKETLDFMKVKDAAVKIVDQGALDCIIKARLETAVLRAAESEFDWKGETK